VVRSAPLHDIGKVGIPDHILLKPGKLTPDEWVIMQTHSRPGSNAIELAESDIETPLPFLSTEKEIAHWHHEKRDGSGYPDGLAGDAIPISARVYKAPMSFAEAREIIAAARGTHFDPDICDAFLSGFDEFVAIARRYQEA
jgi:putative two-component system response regulator